MTVSAPQPMANNSIPADCEAEPAGQRGLRLTNLLLKYKIKSQKNGIARGILQMVNKKGEKS